MRALDCHDVDSTLGSLAGAVGISPAELERGLRGYVEPDDWQDDPWVVMPREVLHRIGASVHSVAGRFDGAYYFHGTRTLEPEAFSRRGILPLDQMIDELWAMLRELVREEVGDEDWEAFRQSIERGAGDHDGWLYRFKTGDRFHSGPNGLLVRETFLNPEPTWSHEYLGCPGIVQDIARCYQAAHGLDLERRFCERSKP